MIDRLNIVRYVLWDVEMNGYRKKLFLWMGWYFNLWMCTKSKDQAILSLLEGRQEFLFKLSSSSTGLSWGKLLDVRRNTSMNLEIGCPLEDTSYPKLTFPYRMLLRTKCVFQIVARDINQQSPCQDIDEVYTCGSKQAENGSIPRHWSTFSPLLVKLGTHEELSPRLPTIEYVGV